VWEKRHSAWRPGVVDAAHLSAVGRIAAESRRFVGLILKIFVAESTAAMDLRLVIEVRLVKMGGRSLESPGLAIAAS
jgi:hypothetical protein